VLFGQGSVTIAASRLRRRKQECPSQISSIARSIARGSSLGQPPDSPPPLYRAFETICGTRPSTVAIACSTSTIFPCGIPPVLIGGVQRGPRPLCRGSRGVPLNRNDSSRAGGWEQPGPCFGANADAIHRAQRPIRRGCGIHPAELPPSRPMFRRQRRRYPSRTTPPNDILQRNADREARHRSGSVSRLTALCPDG